jgi:methylenetetrahydrofolate--tRNA-(uracil-5-)-methyltransferase
MIPGLEKAEFARLGGLHRNTFLNSPKLLGRIPAAAAEDPCRAFALPGSGCEGYSSSNCSAHSGACSVKSTMSLTKLARLGA